MRVQVRLFASFADIAGWRQKELEVPEPATAGQVLEQVRRMYLQVLPRGTRPLLSVNRQHVAPDAPVGEGDEVAVFPPVSGGQGEARARIVTADRLDAAELTESVKHPSCGAVVTFEGVVRDVHDGEDVVAVEYEAYVEMAEGVLRAIADEVEGETPGVRLALAHRTGRLPVGETSVIVAAAAPHRREAFAACRRAMDRIKESLPVWKKEQTTGRHHWVVP